MEYANWPMENDSGPDSIDGPPSFTAVLPSNVVWPVNDTKPMFRAPPTSPVFLEKVLLPMNSNLLDMYIYIYMQKAEPEFPIARVGGNAFPIHNTSSSA